MSPLKRPITPQQALVRLETLCAKAEHCAYEMRTKLANWAIPANDAERIIKSLQSNRYIDDARFAVAFVNDKIRFAGWGRRKVAQALYLKRIEREIIDDALQSVDNDVYISNLEDTVRRKQHSLGDDGNTYVGRTKVFRHAVSRGFEPDLVSKAIRKLSNNQ